MNMAADGANGSLQYTSAVVSDSASDSFGSLQTASAHGSGNANGSNSNMFANVTSFSSGGSTITQNSSGASSANASMSYSSSSTYSDQLQASYSWSLHETGTYASGTYTFSSVVYNLTAQQSETTALATSMIETMGSGQSNSQNESQSDGIPADGYTYNQLLGAGDSGVYQSAFVRRRQL